MKEGRKNRGFKTDIDSTLVTMAYYLFQFYIVRWSVFGFVLEPSIEQIYHGFNADGILRATWGFTGYFEVATFESILLMLFALLPFIVRLLWEARILLIFFIAFIRLIIALMSYINYWSYRLGMSTDKRVINKTGPPGTGKSSSGLWQAVQTARIMWRELRFKYWTMFHKMRKMKRRGITPSDEFLKTWEEVQVSYLYYINNDCVKCLWTVIPVQVGGKFTSILRREHFEQQLRLPAYSVLFADEIGAMITADEGLNRKGSDRPWDISDTFRLIRHFFDGIVIATEQDPENIYIDIRRVVADNEHMVSQKWILKPILPMLLFNLLKWRFLRRPHRRGLRARLLLTLSKWLRYIGFRRFHAVSTGGTEARYTGRQHHRFYCLPTMLNCKYDDRTYRELYKAKNEAIQPDIFQSLILPEDINLLRSRKP